MRFEKDEYRRKNYHFEQIVAPCMYFYLRLNFNEASFASFQPQKLCALLRFFRNSNFRSPISKCLHLQIPWILKVFFMSFEKVGYRRKNYHFENILALRMCFKLRLSFKELSFACFQPQKFCALLRLFSNSKFRSPMFTYENALKR